MITFCYSPSMDGQTHVSLRQKIDRIRTILSQEYQRKHKVPWIIAYSGGKDSTFLLHLVMECLHNVPEEKRVRPVYVVSNDTLVESPLVSEHLHKSMKKIKSSAKKLNLPITATITEPAHSDSFWVQVIGKGYPTPNRMFRWCTDRLKIKPSTEFIKKQVSQSGNVILLMGTRKSESTSRAASINRHKRKGSIYSDHNSLEHCKVLSPIVDFEDDELWTFLLQSKPPWGGSYRNLITLYRNARGGECPTVLSKTEAPGCGSASPRFGCWVCTVVEKDSSLEGLVDSGFEQFEPLVDFRLWLLKIRNDPTYRLAIDRRGKIRKRKDGTIIPGSFTLQAREEILEKLLKLQNKTGMTLISEIEIEEIKGIWEMDAPLMDMKYIRELRPVCVNQ